ncbi:MAG: ABC transporter ATP-binding protein [Nitriliruptorales bacterium]|nr:ABC transporter ATP-binding protein [Nitriliruptorales bacterium]
MPVLACRDLAVSYGEVDVLSGLDLEVAAGETVALLGPSGSGKTTLLYAVAGFVSPSAGRIDIAGVTVSGRGRRPVPAEDREVGLVFQNYALWPHLTALETVAYPVRRRGVERSTAERRARELLALMGIGELGHRKPDQLSGGQQQRVGLARALAREARLYLMDEPTAHLDAALRAALQREIAAVRERTGAAAVYATHDAGEALAVADRVALLRGGRLVQVGAPEEVYSQPVDRWAAELTGVASVLDVAVDDVDRKSLEIEVAGVSLRVGVAEVREGSRARLLVRPEWVSFGSEGAPGTVEHVAFRGPHTEYRLSTPGGELVARQDGRARFHVGDSLTWQLREAWWLPPDEREPTVRTGRDRT